MAKVLILLLCAFVSYLTQELRTELLLLVLIFPLLMELLSDNERLRGMTRVILRSLFWIGEAALLIFYPTAVCFFPLFAFDAVEGSSKRWRLDWSDVAALAPFLVYVRRLVSDWYTNRYTLLMLAVSVFMAYLYQSEKTSEEERKQTRDRLAEELYNLRVNFYRQGESVERRLQLSRLDERNRIARELHDLMGHTLTSSILQLAAIRSVNRDPVLEPMLEKFATHLDQGMTETRESLHALGRSGFDLRDRLETLFRSAEGFDVKLHLALEEDCPIAVQLDMLALVREAVTNALRHSGGDRIEVAILTQPALYSIRVSDNGRHSREKLEALNASGGFREGMGLRGMEEITDRYRGFLNLQGENGFTVHAVLMKGVTDENTAM